VERGEEPAAALPAAPPESFGEQPPA